MDARNHLDLLANGITFTRVKARELIEKYLGSLGCCGGSCGPGEVIAASELLPLRTERAHSLNGSGDQLGMQDLAEDFFDRALREQLSPSDVFRITITSFLDAYNFDVRRLMKCCIHHILPSGHVIPFCAYNVLYRNGHVPLPVLTKMQPARAVP